MWIIYAVLVGIYLTVAASAFVQGQYGFAVAFIIIAVLFVLVRPGSQGPKLVSGVSSGLSGLVQSATGGGTWAAA